MYVFSTCFSLHNGWNFCKSVSSLQLCSGSPRSANSFLMKEQVEWHLRMDFLAPEGFAGVSSLNFARKTGGH